MKYHLVTPLLLLSLTAGFAFGQEKSKTYDSTKKLLAKMNPVDFDSTLRNLFEIGDERIDDLIAALDDSNKDVNVNAQTVIRALGNAKGVNAMYSWYQRVEGFSTYLGGTIPLPLNDFEFRSIDESFFKQPPSNRGVRDSQLYALVLDNSERSNQYLARLNQFGRGKDLQMAQMRKPFNAGGDLPDAVLKNGFFLSKDAKRNSLARLMGYNRAKDRALIYVKTDFGPLAEAWYHVIVQKDGKGWKFVSVVQTAVS